MRGSALVSVVALLLWSESAGAQMQFYNGNAWMGHWAMMHSRITQQAITQNALDRKRPRLSGQPATPTKASHATSYAASAAATRKIDEIFLANVNRQDPAAAQRLKAALARGETFGELYDRLLVGTGLHRGDAADALASYTLLGWMIANGQFQVPSPGAVTAVRQELATSASNNPALALESARAELGEEVAIQFVLLNAEWVEARRAGKLVAYSNQVATIFKQQFGRDLRQMAITDRGFEQRG